MKDRPFEAMSLIQVANGYIVSKVACDASQAQYVASSKEALDELLMELCQIDRSRLSSRDSGLIADPEHGTPVAAESEIPVKEPSTEEGELSRAELIEILEDAGREIPKGTRTTTLREWAAELSDISEPVSEDEPSEGPSMEPPEELELDLTIVEDEPAEMEPAEDECFLCGGNGSFNVPKIGEIECTQCGGSGKNPKPATIDTLRNMGNKILNSVKDASLRGELMKAPKAVSAEFGVNSLPELSADQIQPAHVSLLKSLIKALEGAEGCLI